jgi:hypothetical protein
MREKGIYMDLLPGPPETENLSDANLTFKCWGKQVNL